MAELKVCFYSGEMETLLDQTLSPRFGGAEWRTYITARALNNDPDYSACFAVDEIPEGKETHEGMHLYLIPTIPAHDSTALTLASKSIKLVRAMGATSAERRQRLDEIRNLPPINSWGVLEKYSPKIYDSVIRNRWLSVQRQTGSDWHITWWASSLTYQIVRAAQLLGTRSAVWLSSDMDIEWERPGREALATEQYRWALKHADLVLAQHEGQREGLAAIGVESRILPTGIEVTPDTGQAVRDSILWVASCQRLKQPGLFLELARRLPQVQFKMIMTRRSWSAHYFDELAVEAEGIPNLQIIDGVPDVRPYYDRAVALVNLSTREGFPNTFLEAAVSRTPTVALHVDPEGMLSGGAGVACSGDFELLVRRVAELHSDSGLRERLGSAARSYVSEHHDLVKVTETLKNLMRG